MSDFANPFRRPADVALLFFADRSGAAAVLGQDAKRQIGLRFRIFSQEDRGIAADLDAWSATCVGSDNHAQSGFARAVFNVQWGAT